jgi:hypothetical protein
MKTHDAYEKSMAELRSKMRGSGATPKLNVAKWLAIKSAQTPYNSLQNVVDSYSWQSANASQQPYMRLDDGPFNTFHDCMWKP